jgi:hypothetical protein
MRRLRRNGRVICFCLGIAISAFSATQQAKLADSFQLKVAHIQQNALKRPLDDRPTIFSQDEINAYFSERRLKIPEGVQKVTFDLQPDQVTAFTTVDFEQLRRSHPSSNPLLAIFDGIHDCEVVAHTEDAGPGSVHVTVESVTLDGVRVPKMALQLFISHYVTPKYPNVGLDETYKLPAHIDSATIDTAKGIIVQR